MPVNNKITITSVNGAGVTITSQVFNYVNSITFDYDHQVISIDSGGTVKNISLSPPIATLTYTITSNVAAVVAS